MRGQFWGVCSESKSGSYPRTSGNYRHGRGRERTEGKQRILGRNLKAQKKVEKRPNWENVTGLGEQEVTADTL